MSTKIPLSYYRNPDVVFLAKDLLGKVLVTRIDNQLTGGIITETEAYAGVKDKASHAYGGRRTERTKLMYRPGGYSYVYLCYGIHYLFNIVTGPEDVPHAVLIRGIHPVKGIETITKRRNGIKFDLLANGPGKLSQCLGLDLKANGKLLDGDLVWLEETNVKVNERDIVFWPSNRDRLC